MAADNDLGDRKIVNLERGLFLIEYGGAGDDAFPAKVVVSQAPGRAGQAEFVPHPDSPHDQTLWEPNSALVVRAYEPTALYVAVVPTRPGGSRAAEVRIRPIMLGNPPAVKVDLETVRLVGHVAGVGDVPVSLGEWIAGPAAPSRIEGFTLQWPNQPSGLEIKYSVRAGSAQSPMSPTVGCGQFAGTRGRALPLTGLIIEISGNLSAQYHLIVDAIFLSQPALRVAGRRIVLAGPTGQEPLVGLRLSLQLVQGTVAASPKQVQNPQQAPTPPASAAVAPPPQRSAAAGRVRVFRSRSNSK